MGHSAVSWDMLGPDAFRVARQNGWLLERACAAGLDRLAASDAEAGSNLVESLRVYVACGGDANAAAERLCQHPNSVRNRVNRARAVLAMEDATDKQLFAYLSMIFLQAPRFRRALRATGRGSFAPWVAASPVVGAHNGPPESLWPPPCPASGSPFMLDSRS